MIAEGDLPLAAVIKLGNSHSLRIDTMVRDVIDNSWVVRGDNEEKNDGIKMSPETQQATNTLREYLFQHVYTIRSAEAESDRARVIVRALYAYFNEHRGKLPGESAQYPGEPEQKVVDYIAGMTDQYASRVADELQLIKK
jgi:dGTPase